MKIFVWLLFLLFMTDLHSADEEWILRESKGRVSIEDASAISKTIYAKSIQYDVDPLMVFSIMQKESLFQKNAKNPDGSYGLMQIQEKVHRKKLAGRNPTDIDANLDVGIGVYKYCHSKWKTIEKALNCYNGKVFNNQFASKVLTIFKRMAAHN